MSTLIPSWPIDPLPLIRASSSRTVIVLDDDPTGTQTVRDVPVLTRWTTEMLRDVLDSMIDVAYILTNSRSMTRAQAGATAHEIGLLLRSAMASSTRRWSVISRSDSTLRGHFPHEVDALSIGLGLPDARVLLTPYFGDGGRVTIGGTHYLRRAGELVPVAQTEFASDSVFGYRSSDLREWVAERCGSDTRAVELIDLGRIRTHGPDAVRDALQALPPRGVLVADAAEERDIEVVALGAVLAEAAGVPLIARTAASYVRARAGQPPALPLDSAEIDTGRPGLVVVGSHVPMSTAQLASLLSHPPIEITPIELDVARVLRGPSDRADLAAQIARRGDDALADGRTPVIHTSRLLARGVDAEGDLGIAGLVSATLVDAVRLITHRPSWVLAKGGITSSDIATRALDVQQAQVIGPLLPGVPTWRCGGGSRWPGLTYVVFPGNVGGPEAVREAVSRLAGVVP